MFKTILVREGRYESFKKEAIEEYKHRKEMKMNMREEMFGSTMGRNVRPSDMNSITSTSQIDITHGNEIGLGMKKVNSLNTKPHSKSTALDKFGTFNRNNQRSTKIDVSKLEKIQLKDNNEDDMPKSEDIDTHESRR